VEVPILITGAEGFAGSHLVEQLAAEPRAVVAWRRPSNPPPADLASAAARVAWMAVDILDRDAVTEAMHRVRPAVVFHCAGAAEVASAWRETTSALRTNAFGTHVVLEAVRRTGAPTRVLVPSSALVYRPSTAPLREDDPLQPASPYGLSKLAQELVALEAAREGLDVVVARAFNHIGPRQQPSFALSSFARQIALAEAGRRPPVLRVGNLESRRDVTDVRDTVRAYRLLARAGRPGRPYNVCTGTAPTIGELVERLRRLAHVAITVEVDPARFRPQDTPVLLGDPTRIREEIGWRPEIPLDRTLADLLDYWRSRAATEVDP
jgi:GDP-4-dehydro-6-deoxy-D-mannose reductase